MALRVVRSHSAGPRGVSACRHGAKMAVTKMRVDIKIAGTRPADYIRRMTFDAANIRRISVTCKYFGDKVTKNPRKSNELDIKIKSD